MNLEEREIVINLRKPKSEFSFRNKRYTNFRKIQSGSINGEITRFGILANQIAFAGVCM